MNKISFTSRIKPVCTTQFYSEVSRYGKSAFVDYPWIYTKFVNMANAYTDRLFDCTMLAVSDGQKVFMIHLNPENPINREFNKIEQFLLSKINLKNNELNAILVGSKLTEKSRNLYIFLKTFLKKCGITFSELRNCDMPVNVGYSSSKDCYFISGPKIDTLLKKGLDSNNILAQTFSNVRISEFDQVL